MKIKSIAVGMLCTSVLVFCGKKQDDKGGFQVFHACRGSFHSMLVLIVKIVVPSFQPKGFYGCNVAIFPFSENDFKIPVTR